MSDTAAGLAFALGLYENGRDGLARSVEHLVDDAPSTVARGEEIFAEIAPTLAYLDAPHNPLARALFYCAINLSLYKALAEQGVDVHAYGDAMLKYLRDDATQSATDGEPAESGPDWHQGPGTHEGEFQIEPLEGNEDFSWGYNITSCATCHLFGQHDAMDLVPYMCASDDVMSDQQGQGLRRTGTIALGAHQCDFRYKSGGEPLRVAELYPDKIKFVS